MTNTDSKCDSFKQRLLAVLDYDGIPQSKRVLYLANACGFSMSTARRMLNGTYNIGKANGEMMFILADALKVHYRWIYDGIFQKFEPRTAHIQLVMIDGETPFEADAIINSVCSPVPCEPDYVTVDDPADLGRILIVEQHRRLTKQQKNKNLRFMIRLINGDAKALRWLEMYKLGQISKQQIFQMA